MTTWTLNTLGKKSVARKEFWQKGDKVIIRAEGHRYGEFYCEGDTDPEINLDTPGDYNLSKDGNDWKLLALIDVCWIDWEFSEDITSEEQTEIKNRIAGDYIGGLKDLEWTYNNVEYILQNPLQQSDTTNGYVWG